jgi:hypothetical protein
MQNKTIYIIILISIATGAFLFSQSAPAIKVSEPVIKFFPDEVIEPEVITQNMTANFSVPAGWYINSTGTSIFITKHKVLPEIDNDEGGGYGDRIGISITTLGKNTLESWFSKQYPYDDDPLVHSKKWSKFHQYEMLEEIGESGVAGGGTIVRYVFINDRIVIFSLYLLNPEMNPDDIATLQSIMESYFENNLN